MIFIGIYDDHNASVALMIDGKIVEAINEERFTRIKNETGFPLESLKYIFNKYNLDYNQITAVGICGTDFSGSKDEVLFKRDLIFNVKDHKDYMYKYWEPKLSNKTYDKDYVKKKYHKINKDNSINSLYFNELRYQKDNSYNKYNHKNNIYFIFKKYFKINSEKIFFIDHHLCHLNHAYQSWEKKHQNTAIGITLDAWGDGRNMTVWKIDKDNYELISESSECDVARIYRMTTLYLNMMPLQHEFKVMGLAPYAKSGYSKKVKSILHELIEVKNLKVVYKNRPKNLYKYLEQNFQYFRFDNIAQGLQDFVEEIVIELFSNIYKKTKIKHFVYSGGLSMNVKANKILTEKKFIKDLFVPGAPDDQGTCIGVCYELARKFKKKSYPINNYYLGYEIIKPKFNFNKKSYTQLKDVSINKIVNLLKKGDIVGRASGRMEFGARALGNRSIFANPKTDGIINTINEAIKNRDFWMPFAGSTIPELSKKVILNPKKINDNFMTIAFDTNKKYFNNFKNATHPYDQSIRIQVVSKIQNPWYHELILKFYESTGIPVLLNTSLNLHGYPIVLDEKEAFDIFKLTTLDHILIGNNLFSKIVK